MSGCDHKFVDSIHCLKCGVHIDELRRAALVDVQGVPIAVVHGSEGETLVRPLRPEERTAFLEYVRFCQREPLPKTDAETNQRLFEAAERWPEIARLFGAWGVTP